MSSPSLWQTFAGDAITVSIQTLVHNYLALDVARISKHIDFEQPASYIWTWTRTVDCSIPQAQIAMEVVVGQGLYLRYALAGISIDPYLVPIVTTQPHFGGTRYWFHCPNKKCHKRVRVLYAGKHFLCRHCHSLTYATAQSGGKLLPALENRLTLLGRRLGIQGEIGVTLPRKPSRMHTRTYIRLANEYMRLLQLRERALTSDLFDLIRAFDLGGELPEVPGDVGDKLRNEWKASKAKCDQG